MPRREPTIKRDSVFRFGDQTQPEQPAQAEDTPQQPLPATATEEPQTTTAEAQHAEKPANQQTSVWFSDEEIDWLDTHCHTIRRSGWRGIRRSAFVRALIQALKEKRLDVAGVTNEQELVEAIKRSL
jgi:hypothetical protein